MTASILGLTLSTVALTDIFLPGSPALCIAFAHGSKRLRTADPTGTNCRQIHLLCALPVIFARNPLTLELIWANLSKPTVKVNPATFPPSRNSSNGVVHLWTTMNIIAVILIFNCVFIYFICHFDLLAIFKCYFIVLPFAIYRYNEKYENIIYIH